MNPKILFSRAAKVVSGFILPRGQCQVCGKNDGNGPVPGICFSCFKRRKRTGADSCRFCSDRLPFASGLDVCGRCANDQPSYQKHFNRYKYDGAIRDLVLLFKVEKRYPLAQLMGRSISREVTKNGHGSDLDFVTFIPGSFSRKMSRRFCPAELIARVVSKELRVPLSGFLRLVKNTRIQKGLSARERRENVKNAFECRTVFNNREKILIVDDVFTTGSTLEEASATLKKKGAIVYAATFAMVWSEERNRAIGNTEGAFVGSHAPGCNATNGCCNSRKGGNDGS